MAWLAKALKPFSISPIMVCQIATGSLLLSAIASSEADGELTPLVCIIPYRCGAAVNITHPNYRATASHYFCAAWNRVIERSHQPRERRREHRAALCPPSQRRAASARADGADQRHRTLLRDLRRCRCRTAAADH